MRVLRFIAVSVVVALGPLHPAAGGAPVDGRGDAVVVAVIDTGFAPYHWDYLAATMPQAKDFDPSNDLPLHRPPTEWLPGFPPATSLASVAELRLTLDGADPNRSISALRGQDSARWASIHRSTRSQVHLSWIPDTKVVGLIDFAGAGVYGEGPWEDGQGSASGAVGNLHGTCPECLLVFITIPPCPTHTSICPELEDANDWAMRQPWIDAITNSYGYSLVEGDRVYSRSDVKLQRRAAERGQTQFYAAGDGQDGTRVVPNATLLSSQAGPDWIVTVGAVSASGGGFSGSGKPADVASVGSAYPSAYASTVVAGTGTFSGTSNATAVVAGMYARALHRARRALPGPSRLQEGGVIAEQHPVDDEEPLACAEARPACELADGRLTGGELRSRLLHGARHTGVGMNPGGVGDTPVLTPEQQFLHEGHGSYFARVDAAGWAAEEARIVDPLLGRAAPIPRPSGERAWMTVDSYCRQGAWGPWGEGYFVPGASTLPGADAAFPVRSSLAIACERTIPGDHLPNLVPLPPFGLYVGSSDDGGHRALRLSVSTANRGRHALELSGIPDGVPSIDRPTAAHQCIAWTTHRVCQNRRRAGRFVYHAEHLHYHFEDYALYELRALRADGSPDMTSTGLVAPGEKASFCLIDYDPDGPPPHPVYSQPHPLYLTCTAGYSGGVGFQGISPGWKDTYVASLDGQQILIDDVPDGRYAVVVTADPDDLLWETTNADNVAFTAIELRDDEVLPI